MSEAGTPKEKLWYTQKVPSIPSDFQKLLVDYAKVKPEDVEEHVLRVRDQAWKVKNYPCLGNFRFMSLSLPSLPAYEEVLQRLRTKDEKFLDLGCCLGQDLRVLLNAGVSGEKLYGADLEEPFIDAGYDLFRDRDTCNIDFSHADILDRSSWKQLEHQMDIIYAGSFLHLWDWDDQVQVCKRMVALMVPKANSMIIGHQLGSVKAGPKVAPAGCDLTAKSTWLHDKESFEKMWLEVGRQTNTEWNVQCELRDSGRVRPQDLTQKTKIWSGFDGIKRLVFRVRRI